MLEIIYPNTYNAPEWEYVFSSLKDDAINEACSIWFAQWCEQETLYNDAPKPFFECMPALHALSNRTTANVDAFLETLDKETNEFQYKPGYQGARKIFTGAVAGFGWEGFSMRCWTDPRGYAGYMQLIEQQGLYDVVDDLAQHPHAGQKLKEALTLYGEHIQYPWIAAACIRWAVFGHNTNIDDLPQSVQWLNKLYAAHKIEKKLNDREMLQKPMEFASFSPLIELLIQDTDLWVHLFLQEQQGYSTRQTFKLWLHWNESIGKNFIQEKSLFDMGAEDELCNRILQGDTTQLEMMRLVGMFSYLQMRAVQHHSHIDATIDLPEGLDAVNP